LFLKKNFKRYVAKEVRADFLGNHEDANFTLKRCNAHLNFDEMGLGKTIQSLEALRRLKEQGKLEGPTLIVAPPPCIGVWVAEITRFFKSEFEVRRFVDNNCKVSTLTDLGPEHVIVTTYPVLANCWGTYVREEVNNMPNDELLRFVQIQGHSIAEAKAMPERLRRIELLAKATQDVSKLKGRGLKDGDRKKAYKMLMRTKFAVGIFDEIQKCKSPSAKVKKNEKTKIYNNNFTKVTRAIATVNALYRLGLSGTPIMNSGKEMITLLK
jgi:SNF2 family DNA or RNA helicase